MIFKRSENHFSSQDKSFSKNKVGIVRPLSPILENNGLVNVSSIIQYGRGIVHTEAFDVETDGEKAIYHKNRAISIYYNNSEDELGLIEDELIVRYDFDGKLSEKCLFIIDKVIQRLKYWQYEADIKVSKENIKRQEYKPMIWNNIGGSYQKWKKENIKEPMLLGQEFDLWCQEQEEKAKLNKPPRKKNKHKTPKGQSKAEPKDFPFEDLPEIDSNANGEEKNCKNITLVFYAKNDIEAIEDIVNMHWEYQYHYFAFVKKIFFNNEKVSLNIVIPILYYNYNQTIGTAYVNFEMDDVIAAAKEHTELAKEKFFDLVKCFDNIEIFNSNEQNEIMFTTFNNIHQHP